MKKSPQQELRFLDPLTVSEEDRRRHLVGILNKWPDEPSCRRLVHVIDLFSRAEALRHGFRFISLSELANRPNSQSVAHARALEKQSNVEYRALVAQINKSLGRYRMVPTLRFREGADAEFGWAPVVTEPLDRFETELATWLVELARTQTLNRIRRCVMCKKWLFASRQDQEFCSENCRKKRASTSPEFKERRRKYMAALRRQRKGAR